MGTKALGDKVTNMYLGYTECRFATRSAYLSFLLELIILSQGYANTSSWNTT
jgi:hypothetical protein